MKKRTIFTAVLMMLVLFLTATTATFAWYTAAAGVVSLEFDEVTLKATDETFEAGDLKVEVKAIADEGVGPSTFDGERVNGSSQKAGTAFCYISGSLIEINPSYKTSGKINFSCKVFDGAGVDVTNSLTAEHIATLSNKTFKFTISESSSFIRFGATESAALNSGLSSIIVTLTFKASDGTANFTNVYFAVNSSVELVAGKGKEFALNLTIKE